MPTEQRRGIQLPPIQSLLFPDSFYSPPNPQTIAAANEARGPSNFHIGLRTRSKSNFLASTPESVDTDVAREFHSVIGRILAHNDPETSKCILVDALTELIFPNTGKRRLRTPSIGELDEQPWPKRFKPHHEQRGVTEAPYFNARQYPHPYHSCCERTQKKYLHPCGTCHITLPPFPCGHHSQSGLACRTTSFPCANPPRKLDTPSSICRMVPTNNENLDTPNFDTEDQNLATASQQTLSDNRDDLLDLTAHHNGSRDRLSTTNTTPERRWSKENRPIVFMPPISGAPTKKTTLGPGNARQTNDDGKRICQQCGMTGRRRDGKCIEKWSPGPMGPGSVCDKCRKRMIRAQRS